MQLDTKDILDLSLIVNGRIYDLENKIKVLKDYPEIVEGLTRDKNIAISLLIKLDYLQWF